MTIKINFDFMLNKNLQYIIIPRKHSLYLIYLIAFSKPYYATVVHGNVYVAYRICNKFRFISVYSMLANAVQHTPGQCTLQSNH